jgi:nucleotide-binding universal stress UspA family protein
MLQIRTILHPTDFSEPSQAAWELACALARDYNARLLVVHVYAPPPVYAPDGIAMPLPQEEPAALQARLAALRPADERIPCEHRLLEGEPAEKILELAQQEHADLIVMGTHGTTGLARLLVGSVAESVLRKAPCPVLTVRAAAFPAAQSPS